MWGIPPYSFSTPFPHAACVCVFKRKEDTASVGVCVCPCIVARQIQSSTWLTSDISVSSPLFWHPCAANFSLATQGKTPAQIHLAHLNTLTITLPPLTALFLLSVPLLVCVYWGSGLLWRPHVNTHHSHWRLPKPAERAQVTATIVQTQDFFLFFLSLKPKLLRQYAACFGEIKRKVHQPWSQLQLSSGLYCFRLPAILLKVCFVP